MEQFVLTVLMDPHVLAQRVTQERIASQVRVWDSQTPIHAYYKTFNETVYNCPLSVCRCSQTAGCNSCSIVSGDVSNCSNRLKALPLDEFMSQFDIACFIRENTRKLAETVSSTRVFI